MLSRIDKGVSFKFPGNEGDKKGILKDRVVIESIREIGKTVLYWDVVDLIEFEEEKEPEWMRIGYYRNIGDSLRWASQTTITESLSIWKKLFVKAAREKKWFRDLLEEVMSEMKNSETPPS